jgi:FkbM family methyltransferase
MLRHKVRRLLPTGLRRWLYGAASFLGDEFKDTTSQFGGDSFPSIPAALRYLKAWGFNPATMIDVGAFRGDWTRMAKVIFPAAKVAMIEAQESARPFLQDVSAHLSDVLYRIALLGAVDGEPVDFFEMLTGSSVFEEQSSVPRKKLSTITTRLDTLISNDFKWERIDLLKLDVQGYELEVLKGAPGCLRTCEVVLLEASLIPTNRGCPLIAEVIAFMDSSGFYLTDFCSQIRRTDCALWQTDLLFLNKASRLVPNAELNSSNW